MTDSLVGRRIKVLDVPDLFNLALVGKAGTVVRDPDSPLPQYVVRMDDLYLTAEQAVDIAEAQRADGEEFEPRLAYLYAGEFEVTSC